MDIAAALPTFLITLREGVEAALVVGIVLACLGKAKQGHLYGWVYLGVAAGIAGSLALGIALGMGVQQIQQVFPEIKTLVKPLLNVLFCAIAITLLSWMLLWMTRQSRTLKAELERNVTTALDSQVSSGWSLFSLVCIAVLREGFEAVLFIFTNVDKTVAALGGAVGGVLTAAALGLALFVGGVRINLGLFFKVMGIILLLIVGGLVVSACKSLDAVLITLSQLDQNNSDICVFQASCILGPLVWDASGLLPDKQFPGIVLKTLLGYRDHIYLLQALAYVGFITAVGRRYLRGLEPTSTAK